MNHPREILQSLSKDAYLIPSEIREWWINYLYNHLDRYLDTLSELTKHGLHGKILDVGSAPGHFIVLLKELGYDVIGVDINPDRCMKFFKKYNVEVRKVDIETEKLPFEDRSFDFVLFLEMLEHLRINPLHALREIRRVLKPTGMLILTTPNITLPKRIHFLLGKSYQGNPAKEFAKLEKIGHMGHIRLYTLSEIKELLRFTGFKINRYTYIGKTRRKWKLPAFIKQSLFKPYLCIMATKYYPENMEYLQKFKGVECV